MNLSLLMSAPIINMAIWIYMVILSVINVVLFVDGKLDKGKLCIGDTKFSPKGLLAVYCIGFILIGILLARYIVISGKGRMAGSVMDFFSTSKTTKIMALLVLIYFCISAGMMSLLYKASQNKNCFTANTAQAGLAKTMSIVQLILVFVMALIMSYKFSRENVNV